MYPDTAISKIKVVLVTNCLMKGSLDCPIGRLVPRTGQVRSGQVGQS